MLSTARAGTQRANRHLGSSHVDPHCCMAPRCTLCRRRRWKRGTTLRVSPPLPPTRAPSSTGLASSIVCVRVHVRLPACVRLCSLVGCMPACVTACPHARFMPVYVVAASLSRQRCPSSYAPDDKIYTSSVAGTCFYVCATVVHHWDHGSGLAATAGLLLAHWSCPGDTVVGNMERWVVLDNLLSPGLFLNTLRTCTSMVISSYQ